MITPSVGPLASRLHPSVIFPSLLLALSIVLFSHSPAQALSFAPGTEFLPYKSKRACLNNGGNFMRWQGETYCTRAKNVPKPRPVVSNYRSCTKAGGRIVKTRPPLCLWKGRYFEANKKKRKVIRIRNFKDCVKYGGIIQESHPARCKIGNTVFTQKVKPRPKPKQSSKIKTLHIEPYRKTCWGVGKRKCLVANGQLFYDHIRGFKFQPGYRYKLKVRVTDLSRIPGYVIPADGSSLQYDLVRIQKRQAVRR